MPPKYVRGIPVVCICIVHFVVRVDTPRVESNQILLIQQLE